METELGVERRVGSKQEGCINEQCIAVLQSGTGPEVSFFFLLCIALHL